MFLTSIGFGLGACLFACIAIFGIVASESYPSHLSGTAHAIVALAANGVKLLLVFTIFSQIVKNYSNFSWSNFIRVAVQLHCSNVQLAGCVRDPSNSRVCGYHNTFCISLNNT